MFGLFHVLQLVCGQDLRSFVSKTYVRVWGTLACASESHENIRPSLSFGLSRPQQEHFLRSLPTAQHLVALFHRSLPP